MKFSERNPLTVYVNGRKLNDLTELEQLNADEIKNVKRSLRNHLVRIRCNRQSRYTHPNSKDRRRLRFNTRSSYYQSKNTDWIEQANLNYRHPDLDIFQLHLL